MLPEDLTMLGRSEEAQAGMHHPQQAGRRKALEVDNDGEEVAPGLGTQQ